MCAWAYRVRSSLSGTRPAIQHAIELSCYYGGEHEEVTAATNCNRLTSYLWHEGWRIRVCMVHTTETTVLTLLAQTEVIAYMNMYCYLVVVCSRPIEA